MCRWGLEGGAFGAEPSAYILVLASNALIMQCTDFIRLHGLDWTQGIKDTGLL